VQVFCGAPGVYDGGLQDINVPYSLIHCELYPETTAEGFFWMSAMDFHEYFDTIFECRLVNSGDVAIPNMPPPRIPKSPSWTPIMPADSGFLASAGGTSHHSHSWCEWVFANAGSITTHGLPEFSVRIPDQAAPCEVVCSVEQLDERMLMTTPDRKRPKSVLVKVYESIGGYRGGVYSTQLVCRSNWLPVRDAMVAFTASQGGEFKILVELEDSGVHIKSMIFRCYASKQHVSVTASKSLAAHKLADPVHPPKAWKMTFVGCGNLTVNDKPSHLDEEHDSMRKPEFDLPVGWKELKAQVKEECSIM
jgi:hypothetical protein